jgi:hypothetical protein
MDDAVVEFLEGRGLAEFRFRLGTPDLATGSKIVANEHQHRSVGLRRGDLDQGGCGQCQAAA